MSTVGLKFIVITVTNSFHDEFSKQHTICNLQDDLLGSQATHFSTEKHVLHISGERSL